MPDGWVDVSSDGRYVVLQRDASDVLARDIGLASTILRHDFDTYATIRISVSSSAVQVDFGSEHPRTSDDGDLVAFGPTERTSNRTDRGTSTSPR